MTSNNNMTATLVADHNNIRVYNNTRYLIFRHRNSPVMPGSFIVLDSKRINTLVAWHPVYQMSVSVTITETDDCIRWQCDSMSLAFKVGDTSILIEDSIRLPLRSML